MKVTITFNENCAMQGAKSTGFHAENFFKTGEAMLNATILDDTNPNFYTVKDCYGDIYQVNKTRVSVTIPSQTPEQPKDETRRFELNETYEMRYIGDSDLITLWKCIRLTAKTATFQRENSNEIVTRKIKESQTEEYAVHGPYSMAPSIHAKRKV